MHFGVKKHFKKQPQPHSNKKKIVFIATCEFLPY